MNRKTFDKQVADAFFAMRKQYPVMTSADMQTVAVFSEFLYKQMQVTECRRQMVAIAKNVNRHPKVGATIRSLVRCVGGAYEPHDILEEGETAKVVAVYHDYILVGVYSGFKLKIGEYIVIPEEK